MLPRPGKVSRPRAVLCQDGTSVLGGWSKRYSQRRRDILRPQRMSRSLSPQLSNVILGQSAPPTSRCCLREKWVAVVVAVVVVLAGRLTSRQHVCLSRGRICSDSCACCHTETEVIDQTFYLTQSKYTDTGPTSPGADPITSGA